MSFDDDENLHVHDTIMETMLRIKLGPLVHCYVKIKTWLMLQRSVSTMVSHQRSSSNIQVCALSYYSEYVRSMHSILGTRR